MNIEEYQYLWTTEKDDWVLVMTEFGYGIVNKKTQMALAVSSDELDEALVQHMLKEGNKTYDDILKAYADVN